MMFLLKIWEIINERIKGVKPEIMRVNEREIVRIGIIKLRSAESLCKRVCKRDGGETVAYLQNPPYNPHFAQNLHNLSLICS